MIWIMGVVLLAALAGVGVLLVSVLRRLRLDAAAAGEKMDEVVVTLLRGEGGKKPQFGRDIGGGQSKP